MNSDNSHSRPVVIDVHEYRSKKSFKPHNHASSFKPPPSHQNTSQVENSSNDEDESDEQQVPMELRPLIGAAICYGKKTNALGNLRALKTLKHVLNQLHVIASNLQDSQVNQLINFCQNEINYIQSEIDRAYNE